MTPKEVLKIVTECGLNVETDAHDEVMEQIQNALEKQIPKNPTPHTVVPVEAPIKIGNVNWGKGTTIYSCPNCNEFISRVYTYCPKCGQALDWSDTE